MKYINEYTIYAAVIVGIALLPGILLLVELGQVF